MRYTLDGHVGRQPAMVDGGGDGRTYSGVWPGGQAAENVLPNVCAVRPRRVRSPSCSPAGRGRALIRHAVFPTCCRVDVSSWATSLRRQRREGRYVADKCISLRQCAKHSAHLPRLGAGLRVPSFCKHVRSPRQPFSRLNGTIFEAQVTVTTHQKVVTALRKRRTAAWE